MIMELMVLRVGPTPTSFIPRWMSHLCFLNQGYVVLGACCCCYWLDIFLRVQLFTNSAWHLVCEKAPSTAHDSIEVSGTCIRRCYPHTTIQGPIMVSRSYRWGLYFLLELVLTNRVTSQWQQLCPRSADTITLNDIFDHWD